MHWLRLGRLHSVLLMLAKVRPTRSLLRNEPTKVLITDSRRGLRPRRVRGEPRADRWGLGIDPVDPHTAANSRLAGNVPLNALDNDLVATCELPPGVTCRRPGRTSVVARSRNEWSVSALTVKAQPEIARVY
jgi:hypothetical protein